MCILFPPNGQNWLKRRLQNVWLWLCVTIEHLLIMIFVFHRRKLVGLFMRIQRHCLIIMSQLIFSFYLNVDSNLVLIPSFNDENKSYSTSFLSTCIQCHILTLILILHCNNDVVSTSDKDSRNLYLGSNFRAVPFC